jgi:hypothetical protein
MKKDYTISKFEAVKKPLFILVCNFTPINEVAMYNFSNSRHKLDNCHIGQWIIKYKN